MSSHHKSSTPSDPQSPLLSRIRQANGKDLDIVPRYTWICLYVTAGTEYKVAAQLIQNHIPFFLPLRLDSRNVIQPLWANYLFCRADIYQKSRLRRHFDIKRVIVPSDEEELVLHLKQFSSLSRVVPYEKHDKVKVKSGALSGFVAKVDEVDDDARKVKMSISLLGRTVQVARSYDEVEILAHAKRPINLKSVELLASPPEAIGDEDIIPPPSLNEVNLQLEAISKEFIKYLARHPNLLYEIEPRKFEVLIAELLTDMGYEVELTPESRDGGRDILAALNVPHGKILTLVECKRFKPERKVGIDILERFLWVLDRKDRASCGLIATTSYFSVDARATEKEYKWRLGLKDFDGLREWLSRYGSWTRNSGLGIWLPEGSGDLVS